MMKISKSFPSATFIVILLFISACLEKTKAIKDSMIAKVNGNPLYLQEFLTNFQQLKSEHDEISIKNTRLLEQLKSRALNEIIILSLVRQEANKRRFVVPKEEVEGRLANWKDGYPPGGFDEMLRKLKTSEEFLKKKIEDQLLIERIASEVFTSEILISDDELKKYYKLHEKEFIRSERVHVYQIVVPTREEAEKIRQEILANKQTFESAARQYSLSPDASNGGDLGFFARNEKIEAFNAAFSLLVGVLSDPIQSRYGFHILKVVEKVPTKKLSFDEAKNDIYKLIKRQHESQIYREWITKLLKDAEIYRNEVVFASIL